MFKKITIILFAFTMVLSIVGCKNKKKDSVKYTVTFDTVGAGAISNQEIEEGKYIIMPNDPVKEGYIFEGWYNGESKWNFEENTVTENIILTAKWLEEVEYTVSLMVNGGQLDVSFIKFTDYSKVVLPTPVREFYQFLGWYQGNTKYEQITENANITLTAKWEGEKYNITYHLNDGEFVNNSYITSYKYGTIATLPTPVQQGYNFKGWFINSDTTGTAMYKTTKTTNGDLELYAKWEEKPAEVTYILNGGNWQYRSREEMVEDFLADAMEWGGTTRKPNGMVQGQGDTSVGFANVFGSKFYGFFSDSRYATKWAWLKEYIINTTSNTGSKSSLESGTEAFWRYSVGAFIFQEHRASYPISEDFSQDAAGNGFWDTLSKKSQSTFILDNTGLKTPVRIYYVFEGWYDNKEFTGEPITSTETTTTLYAKWVEETPVDSIKLIDAPTSLDRFEEAQLKWEIAPSNAAIKSVEFSSSNKEIATVSERGVVTALANGVVTITIKSLSPSGVTDSVTITVSTPDYFETSYGSESYVTPGNSITLNAEYIKRDATLVNLVWSSLNPDIATVSNDGVVTAVKEGLATIRVSVENDSSKYFDFVVSVLNKELSDELQFIVNNHESNVFTRYNLGIGAGVPVYYDDIISGVSKYLFEDYVVHTDYYIGDPYCKTAFKEAGVEFITVHYAADMTGNATKGGENLATFNQSKNTSVRDASWHYGIGNDGIWACQSEQWGAWHAGSSKTMTWTNTGIKYKETDPKYATVTLGDDNYFYLNGQNTGIANTTNSKRLNQMGLAYRVVNGEYQLGGHYYNQTYNYISSTGGNQNSIGIETSCAEGSDQWLTWQYTAQLVAKLLIKYNLELTRVVGHHFFSGKDCPQQLLENDMEIWWEFMDMVEAEYISYTQFENIKFNFSVLNGHDILDDNGRITSQPEYNTVVTYKVTLSDGSNVSLATMVPGIYNK